MIKRSSPPSHGHQTQTHIPRTSNLPVSTPPTHSEAYTLALRLEPGSGDQDRGQPTLILEAVAAAASAASSVLAAPAAAAAMGEDGAGRQPRVWRGAFPQECTYVSPHLARSIPAHPLTAIQSQCNPQKPDVEAMAAKTGSARRFPVFVKMLLAALRPSSSSSTSSLAAGAATAGATGVFVDLLTYRDLVRTYLHALAQCPSIHTNQPINNEPNRSSSRPGAAAVGRPPRRQPRGRQESTSATSS